MKVNFLALLGNFQLKQKITAAKKFLKIPKELFSKSSLSRPPQRAKLPYRSINAGEGEFLCLAKKEGEPSSGVLPLFMVAFGIVCHLFEKKVGSADCHARALIY